MKKKSFKKYGYLFMASLTLASAMVGTMGGLATVNADVPSNVVVGDVLPNKTTDRKITLHKYQIDDLSKVLDPGTGAIDPEKVADYEPLAGVVFSIKKVKQKSNKPLTNVREVEEGVDWEEDNAGPTIANQTTAEDGTAVFDITTSADADKTVNDGIYLVEEVSAPEKDGVTYSKMDGFFVYIPQTYRGTTVEGEEDGIGRGLIYDVNVYPKNVLNTDLQPQKTIVTDDANAPLGTPGASIPAGTQFKWHGTVTVPTGLYYQMAQDSVLDYYDENGNLTESKPIAKDEWVHAQYFKIIDDIDKKLTFNQAESKVQYWIPDATNPQDLTLGTWKDMASPAEYKMTVSEVTTPNPANRVEVAFEEAGMEKLVTEGAKKVRVVYSTQTADKDFNGEITNKIKVDYLTPGAKPKKPETPDIPKLYNGGFEVKKTDDNPVEADRVGLDGAEFKLIKLGENQTTDDIKDLVTAGSFVKDVDGNDYVAKTENGGIGIFNGLPLDVDADGAAKPTDYYLIETKAPAGYDTIKEPVKVTVDLTTSDTGYTIESIDEETGAITTKPNDTGFEATVVDSKNTKLPFTGGQGTTILIVIAMGAISIGTAAVVIDKKRRQA